MCGPGTWAEIAIVEPWSWLTARSVASFFPYFSKKKKKRRPRNHSSTNNTRRSVLHSSTLQVLSYHLSEVYLYGHSMACLIGIKQKDKIFQQIQLQSISVATISVNVLRSRVRCTLSDLDSQLECSKNEIPALKESAAFHWCALCMFSFSKLASASELTDSLGADWPPLAWPMFFQFFPVFMKIQTKNWLC